MDVLKRLFEQHFGSPLVAAHPLQGGLGGSGRTIMRLTGQDLSAVGILHDVREENAAFLGFSRHFRSHGLPVPEIYAEDLSQGAYLEEDLGDTTLFQLLGMDRAGETLAPEAIAAYRKVVEVLPRFQIEAGCDLDYKLCYPRARFDRQSIAWDLNYFKYYFLKLAGIAFNEQALEDDFGRLTRLLLTAPRDYFLYRDFQSRNVMMVGDRPFFLDYQGGRKGALQYDVASLLYDAKADLSPEFRQQLLELYLARLGGFLETSRDAFLHHYYAFVYIRIMQALGAYGFRGFYEHKPHFLQSVPYALKNLRWLLQNTELPIALPTLLGTFQAMAASEKLQRLSEAATRVGPSATPERPGGARGEAPIAAGETRTLTVRIFSFSFHQGGPPKDESGHGGGFVFDVRSLPNPGREARFLGLTGKDAAVIEYLQQQERARQFLANALSLVEASVSDYQRRGFQHLMVSFGCTGGRHRSVYMAEQLAQRLRGRTGLEVRVRHLELEKPGSPTSGPEKRHP
ncbi:MAG TPA: RNase adapter RapZ [Terriglobales bacterium]|jgi:aminoglycoside/choline kinase family phosphotransferase|nr:RNase adapter RapZ [Terriglobales bacterium]